MIDASTAGLAFGDGLKIPGVSGRAGAITGLGFLDVKADVLLRRGGNAGGPSPRRSGYGRAGWVDDVHDALEDGDDGRFVDVEPGL